MENVEYDYKTKEPNTRGYVNYTENEHEIWSILITKQKQILASRACDEYLMGLDLLKLPCEQVPQIKEINHNLVKHTVWRLQPVPSLLTSEQFFTMLVHKLFPVATFIRNWHNLDYIAEPDIFHELIGHVPLLLFSPYANFLHSFAKLFLTCKNSHKAMLDRIFFYTIETGLIQTTKGLKIYGGGILSSYNETLFALDSNKANYKALDLLEVSEKIYDLESIQSQYYIIDGFDTLDDILNSKLISKGMRSVTS